MSSPSAPPRAKQFEGAQNSPPILSFNPRKLRVQVTITAAQCSLNELPPQDLIDRAQAKMQAVKALGKVAFFVVYRKKLVATWALLRSAALAGKGPKSMTLTLAAGAPALPGLTVTLGEDKATLANITISADSHTSRQWQLDWLLLHLRKFLRANREDGLVDRAQVLGALMRSRSPVQRPRPTAIKRRRKLPPAKRSFALSLNRARGEVYVTLYSVAHIRALSDVASRLARIEEALASLKGPRRRFHLLKDELLEAIDAALSGPEQLGYGMPLTLLAAIDLASGMSPLTAEAKKPHVPWLTVAVSSDRMLATVASATPPANLQGPDAQAALDAALAVNKVVFGVQPTASIEMVELLSLGRSLAGLVVARGELGVPGAEPFLHVFKSQELRLTDQTGHLNMRQYQRRPFVAAGQQVAAVEHRVPGVAGHDVLGCERPPPAGEGLVQLSLGDGLVQEGSAVFANASGLIEVDEQGGVTLHRALVHPGHVNLASGDVIFDGPAEIQGHVESGATVRVSGDLTITGDIRGGSVFCGGSLTVAQGIGGGSKVRAGKDVSCAFVENAVIECRGTLRVRQSVLQSTVQAGQAILVLAAAGTLGGGKYSCGSHLSTGNLGLPSGSLTVVEVGTDYIVERRILRRQERLEHLRRIHDDEHRTYQRIVATPSAQLSRNEKQAKQNLSRRQMRWRTLLAKAAQHVADALAQRTLDDHAHVEVKALLSTNCQILVAGKAIPILSEISAVVIAGNEHSGSFLKAI